MSNIIAWICDWFPAPGSNTETWRSSKNMAIQIKSMDGCMHGGWASWFIYIINVLKKDRHAREKFNVCCEPYPLFPVNFIVMPLFCCKARMFGGSSSVLFLSTLIILSVYECALIFNVMRIIYLLLDWSCGCMIYDLPACHHVSNHHKTWSFLSKPCPPLATLPKYNPCPPACSYNIPQSLAPLLHWDPAAKYWVEKTKRKRRKKEKGGGVNNLVIIRYLCLKVYKCLVASHPLYLVPFASPLPELNTRHNPRISSWWTLWISIMSSSLWKLYF